MRRIKRLFSAALITGTTLLIAPRAEADIFDNIPADAMVVVKVTNLQATSDKIMVLSDKLGLALLNPDFANPLGSIEERFGITKGVNRGGDFAMVMVDPAVSGVPENKSALMLVPVENYDAFLGNFVATNVTGKITQGKLANDPDGKDVFITLWGEYAAVAPDAALLAKQPDGLKIAGPTGKQVSDSEIVLYANFKKIGPAITPKIAGWREGAAREIESGLTNSNTPEAAKYSTLAKAVGDRAIDIAEAFLNEADAAVVGLHLSDVGVGATVLADFKAEGYIATHLSGVKNADETFLAGLPDAKYIFVAGYTVDPKHLTTLVNDIVAPLLPEIEKLGEDGEPIQKIIDVYTQNLGATESSTFGLVAPLGALGAEGLVEGFGVLKGDAKTIAATMVESIAAQEAIMKLDPSFSLSKVTHTPAALKIEGIDFDLIKTEIVGDAQTPEAAQAQQMIQFMYGPEGAVVYGGIIDDTTYAFGVGTDEAGLISLGQSIKAGADALSTTPAMKVTIDNLPKNRFAAGYLELDALATSALHYAGQFGMPVNLKIEEDLSPIGFTAATEEQSMRIDVFIPADTIQKLVTTAMQAFMQAQQGGGGPRGGGL